MWDKLDAWKSDVVASQIKQLRSDVDELKRQLKNLTTSKQQGPQTLLAYNGEPISQIPGDTLTKQIRKSNQFSLEVAFKTGEANQSGPARLVTLSKGVKNRNFTLGHEGHNLIFRLRTQNSDSNGMLKSGEFPLAKVELGELTHIIVSYDTKELKCYINGAKVKLNANGFSGSLAKWDLGNSLVLKDEKAGKRKWDGEISRVRIFDVAFGANQAKANYNRFLEDLEDNF